MGFDEPYGIKTVKLKPGNDPEKVVQEAFGGQIPDVEGSERIKYKEYDFGGVRIITDHPERPDNGFWRGVLHSSKSFGIFNTPKSTEIKAQKIREKWYEVLEKARESKEIENKKEKQENIKDALRESKHESFRDLLNSLREDIRSGKSLRLNRAEAQINTLLENLNNHS